MHRINSPNDVLETGKVHVDAGGGVYFKIPTSPSGDGETSEGHTALFDSGWDTITDRVSSPVASGNVYIRRTGWTVWLDFSDVLTTEPPSNEWHTWTNLIPTGYSVPRSFTYFPLAFTGARDSQNPENPNTLYNTAQALGPVRLETNGQAIIYGSRTGDGLTPLPVRGLISWPTSDPVPTGL